MVNVESGAKLAAKYAAKYGPHAKAAWDAVGQQATETAKTQAQRTRQRRQAFAKARTVKDGHVLKQVHQGEAVYVVLSGTTPVESYPLIDAGLDALLENADLSKAVSSTNHEAARIRARAARASRRAAQLRRSSSSSD